MKQKPIAFLLPILLLAFAATACASLPGGRGAAKAPGVITLSFAGDCTFGTVNGDDSAVRFPSVYRRSGLKNYPFYWVKPWFLHDDLTIVNFECTLTNAAKTAPKQWHFKGDAKYAAIFPAGSVEAVGLSNNHSHDYLEAGFKDTVANFQKAHVPVFYQNTPYVATRRGVQIVLIGDCTVVGENTTLIDGTPERVLRKIKQYKKPGNIVVVVMHWGTELAATPFKWQQALGHKFVDAGADAVVGHHPHVVQGIERYKGKYIAYSLGNFAFGGNSLVRFPETFILRLRFGKSVGKIGGKVSVLGASIVPCLTTSSRSRNSAGVLRNNYQPVPVFGQAADAVAALVLKRSRGLKYGLKHLIYLRQRRKTMLPERVYRFMLIDLESAPDVLGKMLETIADPSVYDYRPDPARFTLREVVAHLADWDQVFLGRMTQTRHTENPTLQDKDEGQVALDNDYAHADPAESLARYKANRAELVAFLRTLTPAQWERIANHIEVGPITLTAQAVLVGAHDGYHRQQVVEWLDSAAK